MASLSFLAASYSPSLILLCLTFGLVSGCAFGLVHLPSTVMVGHYFERRRALATGIAVCGSSVGTFCIAPLTRLLVRSLGWRPCLRILSALLLLCVPLSAVFRPVSSRKDEESHGARESSGESDGDAVAQGNPDEASQGHPQEGGRWSALGRLMLRPMVALSSVLQLQLLLSPSFLLLTLSGFVNVLGYFVPFAFVVDRAILLGYDADSAAYLLSLIGLANIVTRVTCGLIADHPRVDPLTLNNIALTIGGLALSVSTLLAALSP